MGRKHLGFAEYLIRVPEELRPSVILLETFKGNRTNISFKFSCGCEIKQSLKAFLLRDQFIHCTKCKPKPIKETKINADDFIGLIENEDYVVCFICGFCAKSLGIHVSQEHGISSNDYKKDHKIICSKSSNVYSNQNGQNGNWINRAKENGEDLNDYCERMGKAVSDAILSNPEYRKRRAEVMADVNKSDTMRKKASETAIKTSARREIQLERVARIHAWQKANPQEFYDKCISVALNSWHSIPEIELFNIVKNNKHYDFKLNQTIKSKMFITQSKRKQIDIGDKTRRVYIEFDGLLHFKNTKLEKLEGIRTKDKLLDEHITKHGWVLIRVGYDQFSYRKSDYGFNKECLDRMFEILDKPTPGVHYIGNVYGK